MTCWTRWICRTCSRAQFFEPDVAELDTVALGLEADVSWELAGWPPGGIVRIDQPDRFWSGVTSTHPCWSLSRALGVSCAARVRQPKISARAQAHVFIRAPRLRLYRRRRSDFQMTRVPSRVTRPKSDRPRRRRRPSRHRLHARQCQTGDRVLPGRKSAYQPSRSVSRTAFDRAPGKGLAGC